MTTILNQEGDPVLDDWSSWSDDEKNAAVAKIVGRRADFVGNPITSPDAMRFLVSEAVKRGYQPSMISRNLATVTVDFISATGTSSGPVTHDNFPEAVAHAFYRTFVERMP